MCLAGFAGDDFFICLHAQDARHFGRYGPEGQFGWVFLVTILLALCSLLVFTPMMLGIMGGTTQVDSCIEEYSEIGLFWEMTPLFPYSALWFDSGWPGSCLRLQKTVESPQLQSIVGRRLFPVVAQRQIPMVLFRKL